MVCLTENAKTAYSDFFRADDSSQKENVHVNENPAKGLRASIYDAALDLCVCGGAQVFTEFVNTVEKQSYVYASYVDDPVALITANGDTSFYHQNHLFSTEVMTDNLGAVVETVDYNSYGKATLRDNLNTVISSSAVDNYYYFTGRRLDAESDLYYFRNRYFDVDLGRFTSRDPLGYIDGLSF